MSKDIAIPKIFKDAGYLTAEAILEASLDELTTIEGVGPKTVEALLKKIKGGPEATEITVPKVEEKDKKAFRGYATRANLVLKWFKDGQQFKSSVRVGDPLPEGVSQELIDELLEKRQIQPGLLTKQQVADVYRVELKAE